MVVSVVGVASHRFCGGPGYLLLGGNIARNRFCFLSSTTTSKGGTPPRVTPHQFSQVIYFPSKVQEQRSSRQPSPLFGLLTAVPRVCARPLAATPRACSPSVNVLAAAFHIRTRLATPTGLRCPGLCGVVSPRMSAFSMAQLVWVLPSARELMTPSTITVRLWPLQVFPLIHTTTMRCPPCDSSVTPHVPTSCGRVPTGSLQSF